MKYTLESRRRGSDLSEIVSVLVDLQQAIISQRTDQQTDAGGSALIHQKILQTVSGQAFDL